MRSRLARACVVVCLVAAIGGHWAALQSVAWVSMAVKFARTDPIPVALAKTFDGNHPCTLCKAVEEGKKNQRKESSVTSSTKLDLLLPGFPIQLFTPGVVSNLAGEPGLVTSRVESPPTPPPRLA